MPGIDGAISNNNQNSYIISAEGLQIQGFAVVDSINERDSISSGLATQIGNQTSRCGGFVAVVKDSNGESNNTRAYMFVGSDSSTRNSGDYVSDSDWEDPDNWVEISLGDNYLVDYAVTVQNVSGNKYFLQSGEPGASNDQQPTLTLYRGMRYRFDYSDSSAAGTHPFRIGSAANYSASTSYDSGEGGVQIHHNIESSGKYYLDIVVQHNAPDTLYYHCSQHNGMGGSITVKNLTDGGGGLTTEQVEDIVGAMFNGGTETRISATYDDTNGKIDLVVDDMTANDNTTYSVSCVDGDNSDEEKIRLTDSGGNTDDVVLEAGDGLSITRVGDKITFTNTVSDTNTVDMGDGFKIRDSSNTDKTVTEDQYVKFVTATGALGTSVAGTGTNGDPYVITLTSPDTDTNTVDMGDGFKVRDSSNTDKTVIENQYVKFVTATGALGTTVTGTGSNGDPYVVTLTSPDTDTNTTYTPGDGLDLNGTTFSTDLKANSGLVIDTGEVSIDVNDVTAAVQEGNNTVPDLIREGITGGIEMIGHINSSQGTVKFTFDQFIEAIVAGMIQSEVDSGFGSVDTYTGAGSSIPFDVDGNGTVGVNDLLDVLSFFGATNTTIPRTVLFEYKDDVDDANTNGALGTVSGSSGTISEVNEVIGVITDTDHFEVNTVGTGEKSVDVTIDNTNGSTTEDMVVFKDQTGGATGDVLISALGSQMTNGSIKASLGGWTFINTGAGSFSFYLSMKVGRKVGSTYTFSTPVPITQILGTADLSASVDVVLGLSETVVQMNELVLPTLSADDGTVDVKKVFDAGTASNVDFIAPNTTEVAIQLMYTMIGNGEGQPQQTPRGDVTYTCSVF